MDHFGRLAHLRTVGNVQRRQQPGLQRLVHPALVTAMFLHPIPVEIHVDQALVGLHHAVLQPGRDPQLLGLDRQYQRRLYLKRNRDLVELHQAAERGRDDRAGAGQADLSGDVGLVADREILVVQTMSLTPAVLDELLDRRLHQPDPAVVAVQTDVVDQVVHRVEAALILLAEDQLQPVPFVKRHPGVKVADRKGQRLAVVPVRRIADQAGPRVGVFADQEHEGSG